MKYLQPIERRRIPVENTLLKTGSVTNDDRDRLSRPYTTLVPNHGARSVDEVVNPPFYRPRLWCAFGQCHAPPKPTKQVLRL